MSIGPIYKYPHRGRLADVDPHAGMPVAPPKSPLISSGGVRVLAVLGILFVALGAFCYLDQFQNGLATTAMNNLFTWGLTLAVFAFLVGFGAGGQIVASVLVLRAKQPTRLAAVSSVAGTACLIGAAVAIMADLGNPLNIFAMLGTPNPGSPLVWDMVALTAAIVLSAVMSYMVVAPYARESGRLFLYRWTRKYDDEVAVMNRVSSPARGRLILLVVALNLVAGIALQVVEGLIFALPSAHAWWHSVLVPVDFLAVAVMCGSSLAAGVGATAFGTYSNRDNWDEVRWMARFASVAIVVHLALAVVELAATAFAGGLHAQVLADIGVHWPLYILELALPLLAAALFFRPRERSRSRQWKLAGLLVVVGVFAHRLMLLYPAFDVVALYDGTTPAGTLWEYPVSSGMTGGAATFITDGAYVPTAGEWGVSLLAIGVALFLAASLIGHYVLGRRVGTSARSAGEGD